jgi:Uma2 family endonuclease
VDVRINASSIDQALNVDDIYYPESDGKPMGETGIHALVILRLYGTLRLLLLTYRKRTDVYIAADMFLYYEQGNPKAQKAPDVMVIFGVDGTEERRTFKTWEEKAVPTVIFEITSLSSVVEDLMHKSAQYAELGVKEYFVFDPLFEYLQENSLQGFYLQDGKYTAIEPGADGSCISRELNAKLLRDGHFLRVVDLESGEIMPWPEEAVERFKQVNQRAEQESMRAEQESIRAEQEHTRAEQEYMRAEQAVAEVERLRALLEQYEKKDEE